MSDTQPETDPTDPAESSDAPDGESGVISGLRKKAAQADKLEAENVALRRGMAFDRAGIPEDGMGEMFRDGYQGELDVEAITADATARGLLEPAAEGLTEQEQAQDDVALDRISAATAGAAPPTPSDPITRAKEVGKDGYGDLQAVKDELASLNWTEADIDRIARSG